jgi:hypothetical protein
VLDPPDRKDTMPAALKYHSCRINVFTQTCVTLPPGALSIDLVTPNGRAAIVKPGDSSPASGTIFPGKEVHSLPFKLADDLDLTGARLKVAIDLASEPVTQEVVDLAVYLDGSHDGQEYHRHREGHFLGTVAAKRGAEMVAYLDIP